MLQPGDQGRTDLPGPGVVILDEQPAVVSISPEAEHWLAALGAAKVTITALDAANATFAALGEARAGGAGRCGELPAAVYAVAARSAHLREVPALRLRTRDGQWLIVQRLHISAYTVQEHLRGAFDKFGVSSRRELIAALLAPH